MNKYLLYFSCCLSLAVYSSCVNSQKVTTGTDDFHHLFQSGGWILDSIHNGKGRTVNMMDFWENQPHFVYTGRELRNYCVNLRRIKNSYYSKGSYLYDDSARTLKIIGCLDYFYFPKEYRVLNFNDSLLWCKGYAKHVSRDTMIYVFRHVSDEKVEAWKKASKQRLKKFSLQVVTPVDKKTFESFTNNEKWYLQERYSVYSPDSIENDFLHLQIPYTGGLFYIEDGQIKRPISTGTIPYTTLIKSSDYSITKGNKMDCKVLSATEITILSMTDKDLWFLGASSFYSEKKIQCLYHYVKKLRL